jgi:hypothetical protein
MDPLLFEPERKGTRDADIRCCISHLLVPEACKQTPSPAPAGYDTVIAVARVSAVQGGAEILALCVIAYSRALRAPVVVYSGTYLHAVGAC